MKNVTDFELCCGCGMCVEVCKHNAISMKVNEQGFFYPFVEKDMCVECGRCIKTCAFHATIQDNHDYQLKNALAIKHIDEEVRANSRSGGIFTALSDWIFSQGGVVYGCELVNNRVALHKRATTKKERDKFRGSKYIQSIIFECFELVKRDLSCDRWVLFSGTPCQVSAIKKYCSNINTDKLLLVDIVCHGVPSPMVWSDYLDYVSGNKKIVSVNFRDKKQFGWAEHKETVVFDNGEVYSSNVFAELFFSHLITRKDCSCCPFKNLSRAGDITIADCWGIAESYSQFDDNKGVSLVLINNEKGNSVFDKIEDISVIEVDINKVLQPSLKTNWTIPVEYNRFWNYYKKHSFKSVINKYVYKIPPFWTRLLRRTKRDLRKICIRH